MNDDDYEDPAECEYCGAHSHDSDQCELRWRCYFPRECCMPGEHTSDECHTAEMMVD